MEEQQKTLNAKLRGHYQYCNQVTPFRVVLIRRNPFLQSGIVQLAAQV